MHWLLIIIAALIALTIVKIFWEVLFLLILVGIVVYAISKYKIGNSEEAKGKINSIMTKYAIMAIVLFIAACVTETGADFGNNEKVSEQTNKTVVEKQVTSEEKNKQSKGECQKFCVSPITNRATTASTIAITQKNLHSHQKKPQSNKK